VFNEGVHITEAEKRRGNRGSELQGMPEDELQETPDVELRGKPGSVRIRKPDAAPECDADGESADASDHGRASLESVALDNTGTMPAHVDYMEPMATHAGATLFIFFFLALYRVFSLMKNTPLPYDHHRTPGMVLLQGPRMGVFLMIDVPLYSSSAM
jgi:hypothetical protein